MKNLFLLPLLLLTHLVFAQAPANDECIQAITLTPSATRTYLPGDLASATQSSPNGCVTYMDVFYKYVAASAINVISVTPGSGLDISLSLYSSCSAATPITCSNAYSYNGAETIIATNQVIGNTYYVKVGSANSTKPNNTTFSICVVMPPVNTTCDGAINITPSTTACSYTNGNLTEALYSNYSCGMNQSVFYKFTATSPSTEITLTTSATFDVSAALYSSCNASSLLYCINLNPGSGERISAANLTVGNTYYVQVGATYSSATNTDFAICIQSMPVKANDECAGAATITPSPVCNFINGDLAGASRSASSQPVGCVSQQDIFYKFVAASPSTSIYLNGSSDLDLKATLYASCPTNTSTMYCIDNTGVGGSEVMHAYNLVVGTTYYLSVGSARGNPSTTNFSVCVQSNTVPANDECANATVITPSAACNYINGDLNGATTSATNGCLMDRDIFYQFTATTTKASITLTSGAGLNISAGLYASCTATTPLYCSTTSSTVSPKTILAANLVIGNVYYIKVGSYKYLNPTSTSFSLCVQLPPVNDECAGAIAVTPSASCSTITGNIQTATQSTANGCTMYQDVFYKFVATSASTDITFDKAAGFNLVAALYDNCTATTPLYCATGYYTSAWAQKISATNLTVGNTYYIRVGSAYSTGATAYDFSFCVQSIAVPVNDNCTGATNLPVSATCNYVAGNLAGASQSAANGCTMFQDIFYKFTATATNTMVSFNSSSDLNLLASIYADCAATTPIYCLTNTYKTGETKTIAATNLIIGNTYYIKVGSAAASPISSAFEICVKNYAPASNDEIINATSITPSTTCNNVSGDLANASHSPANGCDMLTDMFYKFVAASPIANISTTPSSGLQLTIAVYESTTATSPMTCVNSTAPGAARQFAIQNLVPGNTYYIKLGSYLYGAPATTTFDVCVQTMQIPANDFCTDAIEITPSGTCSYVNGDLAFSKASAPTSCSNSNVLDVFYKFTATGPGASINVQPSTGLDVVLALFDNCAATTSLYCTNNGGTGSGEVFTASNLITGNTYYIKISGATSYYTPTTTFSICIQPAISSANDLCADAITLVSGSNCNAVSGNLSGSTRSATNGCIMTTDVFYKFIATAAITQIDLTASASLNITAALYSGCSETTALYCVHDSYAYGNTEKLVASNLTVGNTYYIKVGSYTTNPATTDFTICVKSLTPRVNDECVNAISITPSSTCNPITADLLGATQSTLAGCTAYSDIFYKFIAASEVANITFTTSPNLNLSIGVYASCNATTALYCDNVGLGNTKTINATDLVIGNTYYIKAGSRNGGLLSSTFSICVQTIQKPAADECAGAITIVPAPTCTYTNGDLATASQSPANGCISYKDVFYKFVAQTSNTDIAFSASTGLFLAVSLQTDCTGSALYCINNTVAGGSNIISATNLTVGNTYFIKVGSTIATPTSTEFSICVRSGMPANDDLTNALSVTPATSCITTAGNLLYATSSATNGCTMYKDVFYKFVAGAPHYKLSFTPDANLDITAALYSGNSTTPLACVNNAGNGGLETIRALDLTIGSTYYIKVGSYTNTPVSNTFSFCIEKIQASNDECATAISVTPAATCTYITGDLAIATKSLLNGFDQGKDVFYKFVANSNAVTITASVQGNSHVGINLLSSCTKKVYSDSDTMYVHNLVIGNTYYIQLTTSIYDINSEFSLCIQSITNPENDECANAILIPASFIRKSVGETIFADLSLATKSLQTSCSQVIYKDRFYKFVAKSATLIMNYNNSFNLFSGLTLGCGTNAELKLCGTNTYGGNAWGIFNMVVGETYYLRLGTLDSAPSESTFSFSLGYIPDEPLPVNDECAGALTLVPNMTRSFTQGDLRGALRSNVLNDGCYAGIKDAFYKFVATASTAKIVFKQNSSVDFQLSLNGSCPATPANALYCKSITSTSDSIMATNLTVGKTYYIKLGCNQAHGDLNSFSILVEAVAPYVPPVANDECPGAFTLTPTTVRNLTKGNFINALQSGSSTGCSAARDVFYKFVANTNAAKIFFTNPAGHTLSVGLYSNCPATTNLYCELGSMSDSIIASNLTIGNTYYIKVGSNALTSDTNSFYLFVESLAPAANDECVNALSIIPSFTCNTMSGDLARATQSASNGCTSYSDVFYKFVASSEEVKISYTGSTFLQLTVGVYPSCNASAPALFCIPNTIKGGSDVLTASSLTVGNTYYIKMGSSVPGNLLSTTFTVCVQNTKAVNDECANALPLTPSPNIQFVSGDLINAGKSSLFSSACTRETDLFYKFTANSSSMKIILESSAGLDAVVSVATSCSASSDITCQNNTGVGEIEEVVLSSLTPGVTYYVMVGNAVSNTSAARTNVSATSTFRIALQEMGITTDVSTNQALKNITIYPNPSYGNVHFSNITGLTQIEVMSIEGKILFTKELSSDASINMETLSSGIYMLRLIYNDISEIRRVEIIK